MPKETISPACGPYLPKVGWAADRDVQLGVEVEGERSIFWTLLGADEEARERLGQEVRRLVAAGAGNGSSAASAGDLGCQMLDLLDTLTGSYAGVWATLDREGCNRLVRVLRRARDSAFGRDE